MDDKRRAEIRELIRIMNGELFAELVEHERQVEARERAAPSFEKTFLDPNQMDFILMRMKPPLERCMVAALKMATLVRVNGYEKLPAHIEAHLDGLKLEIHGALAEMQPKHRKPCAIILEGLINEVGE